MARPSTADLFIMAACFVKKGQSYFQHENELIQTSYYKEVNRDEPSSSVRVPWFLLTPILTERERSPLSIERAKTDLAYSINKNETFQLFFVSPRSV
jgi:hypothetical protein